MSRVRNTLHGRAQWARSSWSRWRVCVQVTLAVAAIGLSIYAVSTRWGEVSRGLARIGWVRAGFSAPLLLAGLLCGMLSWRAVLARLGSKLPIHDAGRIYFVGQLGKYLPGSLWPVLAQMELGKKYLISRKRSIAALGVAILTSVMSAVIFIAFALPWLTARHHQGFRWLLLLVPLSVILLQPRVIYSLVGRLPLLKVDAQLAARLPARLALKPLCWAALGWLCFGAHVFLLASAFPETHAFHLFIVCVGGYALAWVAGMIAFLLPAGAGARDVVLVYALSTQLPVSAAVAIAVVSRALTTVGDLGWAAAAVGRTGIKPKSAQPTSPTGPAPSSEPAAVLLEHRQAPVARVLAAERTTSLR